MQLYCVPRVVLVDNEGDNSSLRVTPCSGPDEEINAELAVDPEGSSG